MSTLNKPQIVDEGAFDYGDTSPEKLRPARPSGKSFIAQPGRYDFVLPANLGDEASYERYNATVKEKPFAAIRWPFKAEPIRFLGGQYDGDPIEYYSISTQPRQRGKKAPWASDVLYLLRDGVGVEIPSGSIGNNFWIQAMSIASGHAFGAWVEYTTSCNPKRTKRIYDPEQRKAIEVDGSSGCGESYYQSAFEDAKKSGDSDYYPAFITCTGKDVKGQVCGASLRAFITLTAFHTSKTQLPKPNGQ